MTPQSQPCMLLHVDDYLTATAHLSLKESGALFMLMAHAAQHDGHLQQDDARLQFISRLSRAEWKKSKARLLAFFYRSEQGSMRNQLVDDGLQMHALTNLIQ